MDLKNFVAEPLTQIVQGVSLSSAAVSELGGAVSPAYYPKSELLGTTRDGANNPVYGVQFDVAVIASSIDSQEGGGALRVVGIGGFGGKLSGTEKEETSSRVRFVVPLQLPTDPKSQEAVKQLAVAQARAREQEDERISAHNRGSR